MTTRRFPAVAAAPRRRTRSHRAGVRPPQSTPRKRRCQATGHRACGACGQRRLAWTAGLALVTLGSMAGAVALWGDPQLDGVELAAATAGAPQGGDPVGSNESPRVAEGRAGLPATIETAPAAIAGHAAAVASVVPAPPRS